jgi:arylformamidase
VFIEMSYPLSPEIPSYPGSPLEEFTPNTRRKNGDDSNTTIIKHYLHNGTHVDAPFHFYDQGLTIDQIAIDRFAYSKPVVINKELSAGQLFTVDDLKSAGSALYQADICILSSGYYKKRADKSVYIDNFPALSKEAAQFIRTELLNIKAVAIDTLSIESCIDGPKYGFLVHKSLLAGDLFATRPLLVYEDVNVGAVLHHEIERIFAFPIRLVGLDGSPVAMVAEVKA